MQDTQHTTLFVGLNWGKLFVERFHGHDKVKLEIPDALNEGAWHHVRVECINDTVSVSIWLKVAF